MKSIWINKHVKISVRVHGRTLFYTARVLSDTQEHLGFVDRENKLYSYPWRDILQIEEVARK